MMLGTVAGLSILVMIAVDTVPAATPLNPVPQRPAAMQPLIRSANECIARQVSSDPRFADLVKGGNVNDLIVDSIPPCVDAVRAMIRQHDEIYGEGTGETFFMGPYLDALPTVVNNLVRDIGR